MGSNPGRRTRRAARFGRRQPTRMSEYQRARQSEQPRGEVKVHAHLHRLELNAAVELDEAGAFEGLLCGNDCGHAVEWSADLDEWQHHATKRVRCTGKHGRAIPPDWYAGDPVSEEVFDTTEDYVGEDLTSECDIPAKPFQPNVTTAPVKPPRVDGNPYDTEFGRMMTAAMQTRAIYQQTVQADEIERRRLRNRDANRARRANRRARVKRSQSRFARNRAAA